MLEINKVQISTIAGAARAVLSPNQVDALKALDDKWEQISTFLKNKRGNQEGRLTALAELVPYANLRGKSGELAALFKAELGALHPSLINKPAILVMANAQCARCLFSADRGEDAAPYIENAQSLEQFVEAPLPKAFLAMAKASQAAYKRDFKDQESFLVGALELFRSADAQTGVHLALTSLGLRQYSGIEHGSEQRFPEVALGTHREALALARELGVPSLIGDSCHWAGNMCRELGDAVSTEKYYQEAQKAFGQVGSYFRQGAIPFEYSVAECERGHFENAYRLAEEAVAIWQSAGRLYHVAMAETRLGIIQKAMGDAHPGLRLQHYGQAYLHHQHAEQIYLGLSDPATHLPYAYASALSGAALAVTEPDVKAAAAGLILKRMNEMGSQPLSFDAGTLSSWADILKIAEGISRADQGT